VSKIICANAALLLISSTFYARVFRAKFWRQKVSKPKQSFVIFGAKISYKKQTSKMLMKLTPGLKVLVKLNPVGKQNNFHMHCATITFS
jgi:hypothetical protein